MARGAQPRDRYLMARGLQFHYRDWGDTGAPVALLLHGLTGNSWEWDPISDHLAVDFRVIALDQRGHGASSWADGYSVNELADDLHAIIQRLDLAPLNVVGHSMGGMAATTLAARHAPMVERLVVVDIGPDSLFQSWVPDMLQSLLTTAASATFASVDEAVGMWCSGNPQARPDPTRHFVAHNLVQGSDGAWRWRFDAASLADFYRQAPREADQWAALAQVKCPTLIIRGSESDLLSAATASRMTQLLPDGRCVELKNGGHDLTVELPEPLAEAIHAFLLAQ